MQSLRLRPWCFGLKAPHRDDSIISQLHAPRVLDAGQSDIELAFIRLQDGHDIPHDFAVDEESAP